MTWHGGTWAAGGCRTSQVYKPFFWGAGLYDRYLELINENLSQVSKFHHTGTSLSHWCAWSMLNTIGNIWYLMYGNTHWVTDVPESMWVWLEIWYLMPSIGKLSCSRFAKTALAPGFQTQPHILLKSIEPIGGYSYISHDVTSIPIQPHLQLGCNRT